MSYVFTECTTKANTSKELKTRGQASCTTDGFLASVAENDVLFDQDNIGGSPE